MTIRVHNDRNLSATTGVTIDSGGIIELEEYGNLLSSAIHVESGGRLVGNGTVVGNLMVGTTGGSQTARSVPVSRSATWMWTATISKEPTASC